LDRTEWLKVRLTATELEKLKAYAIGKGWNMSQAVREWIRRLPTLGKE
jgi:hypothetical protein